MPNQTLDRYKQNLRLVPQNITQCYVKSYDTHVGLIDWKKSTLTKLPWNVKGVSSSSTTTKHINYVANLYDLKIISHD